MDTQHTSPLDILPAERQDALTKSLRRSSQIIQYSVGALVLVITIMLVFIIIMLFSLQTQIAGSIDELKRDNAANHEITQQYIRCVAITQTRPLAERKADDLDKCAVNNTKKNNAESSPNTPQQPTKDSSVNLPSTQGATLPEQRSGPETPRDNPGTSAPPDPDNAAIQPLIDQNILKITLPQTPQLDNLLNRVGL